MSEHHCENCCPHPKKRPPPPPPVRSVMGPEQRESRPRPAPVAQPGPGMLRARPIPGSGRESDASIVPAMLVVLGGLIVLLLTVILTK